MGGKNYIHKGIDAERRERGASMQARQDLLRQRMDRLGMTEQERRDLVRVAIDGDISIHTLLSDLEQAMRDASIASIPYPRVLLAADVPQLYWPQDRERIMAEVAAETLRQLQS